MTAATASKHALTVARLVSIKRNAVTRPTYGNRTLQPRLCVRDAGAPDGWRSVMSGLHGEGCETFAGVGMEHTHQLLLTSKRGHDD
jgi:hypothetical protein